MTPHVVFDLDGTLIDSVHDLAASASELVTSFGGRPLAEHDVALMVGDGAGTLVRRALATSGLSPETPDALARFLEIYDRRLLETTTAYEGVDDMLLAVQRRAHAHVLTNKPLAASQKILDALGLTRYFEHIVGGDAPYGRKPDPAGVRSITGGAPYVLMVGDSPVDWHTAQAAGCGFAWARYGFGAARFVAPPSTPYVFDRAADFGNVLDRFCAVMSGT